MMMRIVLLLLCAYQSRGKATQEEVVTGIGIKLCNQKCVERGSCMSFAYAIDRLACHLLHNDSIKWTMKEGYVVHSKHRSQLSSCVLANCGLNTRCVDRRHGGAVCVKVPTLYNSEHGTSLAFTSALESRCVTDSDCPADRMFVCFTKTCKCVPGYSFNPANSSCVRRCKVYGNGLTTYQGLGLVDYNNRITTTKSEKECSNMCISEDRFTCLTFEYHLSLHRCQISNSGYLDVEDSKKETGLQDWIFVVRNCA